ncbi:hypothetical protein [Variovorax sp. HW608]|uniref:hypothetical protein n=1 Tax=Variovorax sp. HW608 TaxID=1034889 RepID=UPI000B5ACC1A|nr:hypothetical protein [Variovorax sp. HW608]
MPDLSTFLQGLATAWKDAEVRPTHRTKPAAERWWRARPGPFEHAWQVVEGWLEAEPTTMAKALMDRLAHAVPDAYTSKAQLRTLQQRIKAWLAEKAKDLILGKLRNLAIARTAYSALVVRRSIAEAQKIKSERVATARQCT